MSTRQTGFIERLRKVAEALPSEEEKAVIRRSIQDLIDYLRFLEDSIGGMPTNNDARDLLVRLNAIEEQLSAHRSMSILGKIIGQPKKQTTGIRRATPLDLEQGRKDLERMKTMSVEDLRNALKNEKVYTVRKIRALLEILGVHVPSKTVRAELADLLVTKISNYAGYELLRGQ